ncbi:MAG: spinster family MFS transporter [Myxococcaceae bacterium]
MTEQAVGGKATAMRGAYFGLVTLTLINLLNYLDRYVVPGSLVKIEQTFHLDHDQSGSLLSLFFIVYMIASPLGGWLGDNVPRKWIVGVSVLLWSAATIASGLSKTYPQLLVARSLIGVGEAGYATVAPAIISDLFSRQRRASMLSVFYMAIPLGAALGFGVGGYVSEHYSWNTAFFVAGTPGILFGLLAFVMPEPKRGASDEGEHHKVPMREGLANLRGNRLFWFNTAGLTLMTFSIGGLGNWMPAYLELERHMKGDFAGIAVGGITAVAGIIGTLTGGWLGDWADKKRPFGSMYVSGSGLLLAVPFMILTTLVSGSYAIFTMIFIAQFFLFLNSGPINAALMNAVPPGFRAFAMGLNVLIIHLFGDAASPKVIGKIGTYYSLGTAIQVNALPVLLGGLILVLGVRAVAGSRSPPGTVPTT